MKIPVDKSRIPSGVSYFKNISSIDLEKEDLFKLGIFKHEIPPTHLHDSDYLYLLSKVAAYMQIYSDFITVSGNSIINMSSDDRMMKEVSEIVGIALGIKLAIDCFGVRQERIVKIPPPSDKKKYLDYSFQSKTKEYELETKGTTSNSIQRFVDDIAAKKAASTKIVHFRFGTVTVLSKPGKSHGTQVHLCDDPPSEVGELMADDDSPWHYLSAIGFILDNKYYNQLIHSVLQGKKPRKKLVKIKDRFFGRYIFGNETYFGEFFDYRVNLKNLSDVVGDKERTVDEVFQKVTRAQGRKKIFIGVHSQVVDLVLKGEGLNEILKIQFGRIKEITPEGVEILRDSDGVIVVIASDKKDSQIESQFPEGEVKNRIGQLLRFQQHEPTECGSPCRSREKAGKPCAIKTYRGTCHFHR